MIERERERQRHRRTEKQAPCREPDAGLDPRTPGSCPGPKAGAKSLSHPGIPVRSIFNHTKLLQTTNVLPGRNSPRLLASARQAGQR